LGYCTSGGVGHFGVLDFKKNITAKDMRHSGSEQYGMISSQSVHLSPAPLPPPPTRPCCTLNTLPTLLTDPASHSHSHPPAPSPLSTHTVPSTNSQPFLSFLFSFPNQPCPPPNLKLSASLSAFSLLSVHTFSLSYPAGRGRGVKGDKTIFV
jgi:hypothetical protein